MNNPDKGNEKVVDILRYHVVMNRLLKENEILLLQRNWLIVLVIVLFVGLIRTMVL